MKIGILDYGNCNANFVYQTLLNLGYESEKIQISKKLNHIDKLIIPGNSNALSAVKFLKKNMLEQDILNFVEKKMIIGICLGVQIFCKKIEEGKCEGLGFLDADVLPLTLQQNNLKKNIGWKKIYSDKDDFKFDYNYYFCHSYFINFKKKSNFIISQTLEKIPAVIVKNNLVGFQFHPEKSQSKGLGILSYFLDL